MKLRIRPQMVIGFLLMNVLLIIVGAFAIFYTNRMQKNTARILSENVSSLKSAEELEIALLDMKGLTANYLLYRQEKWLKIFNEKKTAFSNWFQEARRRSHTVAEKLILDEIEKKFQLYIKLQKQTIQYFQNGAIEQAQNIHSIQIQIIFDQIYKKCEELLFINEKMMQNTSLKIMDDNRTVKKIIYGIGIMGGLLGLGLGWFLAYHITHSIYEIVLKVKGATNEDIVETLQIIGETELEHLDRHVKKLIEKVNAANINLERSQRLLIRSEKLAALGQMSAGLAHEIRNPLTAIKMVIFSIQKEIKKNPRIKKDIRVIIHEIVRIERFLENFLDFARPPEPNFGTINLIQLIDHTLTLLLPQIKSVPIQLEKKYHSDKVFIYGDRAQLQQVFVNIILNAIQSMSEGGTLKIQTAFSKSLSDDVESVRVLIRDTGPGIPVSIFNEIFDPFVTSKDTGIGLGLSIAYQIIQKHNGWIEAMNDRDQGATFTVNLPVIRSDK